MRTLAPLCGDERRFPAHRQAYDKILAPVQDRISRPVVNPDADVMLVRRLVERDERALAELYDRHSRLIFGLLLRIIGNRAEAEDALQEVFFAVWSKAGTYDVTLGSPAGWIVGIARHRALDRLRASATRSRTLEAVSRESERARTPEQEAESGEQRHAVVSALESLADNQRRLIEDAYFLGLTHSELAERHGLPLGTVKTRIRAGMLALRQHLAHVYAQQ
jgi:RNA polymerase sigma-70 factor (ECF subfamily)